MSKCYDNPDYDDSESDIQNTWNQHPKVEQERKKNFYCGDEVDYDDKCLEQCDRCVDATGVDYGYLPEEETKCYCGHTTTCDCGPEDSKQTIIDMMKGDEELGLYDEIQPEQIWNEEKKKGIKQLIQDHKQETLKEAAERLFPNKMEEYDIFLIGARWQQERMYSEEDMKSAFEVGFSIGYERDVHAINENNRICKEWFEQFKKK